MYLPHRWNFFRIYGATIILGINEVDDWSDAQKFKKKKVYFYNNSHFYKEPHDIALIRLDREVEFNWYIQPICLNTQLDIQLKELTASGWGKYEGNSVP